MDTSKRKGRVGVIGLDGVPHGLLQELAQKGIMPAMARLISSGHLHRMKASLPEISSVSWTNFMTGVNPGTHGIFGFTDLKEGTYDLRFPNFLSVRKETFWDILGQYNKKSIVINQPSTYPAKRINGALVSGFVAIDPNKSFFPLSHKAALEKMGYQIDIDTFVARHNHSFLWEELDKTLVSGRNALHYFWEQEWDYFEFIITGTDRLHHFLWNAYGDESHQYHQRFLDYYREVDRLIDEIVTCFQKVTGDEKGLYLLSDHGFTGIEQELYLNAWLEKNGFLKYRIPAPEGLADISSETKAFALDPSRIHINLKGRYPLGSVEETDKKALKKDISAALEGLEYNGKKVIRKVFDTEEIYSGPFVSKGPDLVVLSANGFDLKGSVQKKEIFNGTDLAGMHTWDDAFFWAKENRGDDLTITDCAKMIMENFL